MKLFKKRWQNITSSIVAGVVLSVLSVDQWSQYVSNRDLPAPGVLVDIGGYKLHLNCTGSGKPTVLLDAGGANWSIHWDMVQRPLSVTTQVCSYDRAGYGWSEQGPSPRDLNTIVGELRNLIVAAEIDLPLIYVGHSAGGAIGQLYTQTYPQDVAALVLIDSRSKGFIEALSQIDRSAVEAFETTSRIGSVLDTLRLMPIMLSVMKRNPPDGLSEIALQAYIDPAMSAKGYATASYEQLADAATELQLQAVTDLQEIPLAVISHGKLNMFSKNFGMAEDLAQEAEVAWARMQNQLLQLSSNSKQYIAYKSGHLIIYEQPEIIIEVVEYLLESL